MTQLKRILWFAVIVATALLLPGRAAAQSGTVTDDAFASSNATTQLLNLNGQGISLIVAGSTATVGSLHVGSTNSYIKFQLQSSLPPNIAANNVAKATLKLYLSPSVSPSGAINIIPVTSPWSESTLMPSAQPTLAGTPFASNVSVGKDNSFLAVDVTQLVQDWLNGSANGGLDNDGIALEPATSSTYVVFDSKESIVTSHEPRLEIVLTDSGPVGPQGPQGPQGPTGSTGAPGLAATVTTGTTMTVPAGTPASVLNGGTSNAAVLNFMIPQGPAGLTGPQGPQGPVGINNRSAWVSGTPYQPNDAVSYNNSFWMATAADNGSEPPPGNANWQLLAAGINNRGAWSASASYNINDAVTDAGSFWLAIAPTSSAATPSTSCEPSQASCSAVWELLAAMGSQGPTGSQGPAGSAGTAGVPGAAATIQVGNVTTGGPGSQAAVTNSGSPNAAVLNFTIPQGIAGAGSAPSSVLPAFLPGPLTQSYIAASFFPDSPITVTRVSAALKTAPDPACQSSILRVTNGTTGQDIQIVGGGSSDDSGPMALPTSAGANLQVLVQTPASCPQTNPADANVLVSYRSQQSGDTQVCAQSGLACNGICEETQTDTKNCGACGTICSAGQTCIGATCANPACNPGLTTCGGTCVNLQTDTANCGACGNACPASPTGVGFCAAGKCSMQCSQNGAGTLQLCGNACVNIESDPNNCGACGNVCSTGQTCFFNQITIACVSPSNCTHRAVITNTGVLVTYNDCSNQSGVPGNTNTYNLTMAQEAVNASAPGSSPVSVTCSGAAALALPNGYTWVYQGMLAGYVNVPLPGTGGLQCPTTSSLTWW